MNGWPVHSFQSWDDFLQGQVLLIDKPREWTSFDVVNKVRHLIRRGGGFKKIKVGHAGTLDPLATGVLVLCTGRMTKRIAELSAEDKAYDGHITFGANTDSHDLEMPLIPVGPTDGLSLDSLRETALKLSPDRLSNFRQISAPRKSADKRLTLLPARERTSASALSQFRSTDSISLPGKTPKCRLISCAPRALISGPLRETWEKLLAVAPTSPRFGALRAARSTLMNAGL